MPVDIGEKILMSRREFLQRVAVASASGIALDNPLASAAARPGIGAYGGKSLPAWIPDEGTWAFIGDNTIRNVIPSIQECPGCYTGNGPPAWLNWTGASYNPDDGVYGCYALTLGGHGDGSDNSLKVFRFGENHWVRINRPSGAPVNTAANVYGEYIGYPAGVPAASHTYGLTQYLPRAFGGGHAGSTILPILNAATAGAGAYGYAHACDHAAGMWSRWSTNGLSNPPQVASACHDGRGNYYVTGSGGTVSRLDNATRRWSTFSVTTSGINLNLGGTNASGFHPRLRMWLVLDCVNAPFTLWGIYVDQVAQGNGTWHRLVLTGTPPQHGTAGPSLEWCDWLGKFAVYEHVPGNAAAGTGQRILDHIRWLTPPVTDVVTNSWRWSSEIFTSSATLPQFAGISQIYNRMQAIPVLRSLAFVESIDARMMLFRPRMS